VRVRIHEAAADEFREAVEFYERKVEGLGSEYAAEVADAFDEIAEAPERWPSVFSTEDGAIVRRHILRRFPVAVFYERRGVDLIILAVAHQRQRPGYWRKRRSRGR
jgi:toxin ParE1/3/4